MNDLGRHLRLYTNKVIDLLGPPLLTFCDSRGIETPIDYQCFRSNFDTFWSVYQSRLEVFVLSQKNDHLAMVILFLCDSGGIQTHNLLIRSQMLYSVELRNLRSCI